MRIDSHSHFVPPALLGLQQTRIAAPVSIELVRRTGGPEAITVNGHAVGPVDSRMYDVHRQIEDMDQTGLERKVLSIPPFLFLYPYENADYCRAVNEAYARIQQQYPDRFIGIATVPLQNPGQAIAELDYAVNELGLRGVEIGTHINGVGLDDPGIFAFLEAAQDLDVAVITHPDAVAGTERMKTYHLRNLVGNPLETALAGAKLIFGGVLDRLPRLRVALAHGGGFLPYLIGRMEQGRLVRSECTTKREAPIREQMRRLYFDTVVFDPAVMRFLVDVVGADRVLLGSDYPFDMSMADPIDPVRRLGLEPRAAFDIIEQNAQLFLGIE